MFRFCIFFCSILTACQLFAAEAPDKTMPKENKVVRAAIIGGMSITTELFAEISKMFEADTGYKVRVVAEGPRPGLADAMRQGKVDFLTMHSGDITTDLVADGYAVNMRPWAKNDLIIIGPASDPARIAGYKDGAAALKRIAETESNYVDLKGIGSRELGNSLWKKAEVERTGKWVIKDESIDHDDLLGFVERHNAYIIIGRLPVTTGKLGSHKLKIMVDRDPVMRRPYIAMEASTERFPDANVKGARALSDYLLSDKVQGFMARYGKEYNDGIPYFHPVKSAFESH